MKNSWGKNGTGIWKIFVKYEIKACLKTCSSSFFSLPFLLSSACTFIVLISFPPPPFHCSPILKKTNPGDCYGECLKALNVVFYTRASNTHRQDTMYQKIV